ncbi:hypothetical protein [Neobacillus bataviensis]|uniref:hypothetical protein n=1 Tax=Neobacillus bataviensis TaxID=220685 RepID=UPI001CBC7168|nr:hypothetical protein [Neobacillus bataviensis]
MKEWKVTIIIFMMLTGGYFFFLQYKYIDTSGVEPVKEAPKRDMPLYTDTQRDKTWEIHFPKEFDKKASHYEDVKVTDNHQNEVPVIIELGTDQKTIYIHPPQPEGLYKKGMTYHVKWKEDLRYADGTKVEETKDFDFVTIK